MKFCIVASKKDLAGMNIFKFIHEDYPSLSHYLIEKDSVYADNIDKTLLKNYDFIIFISKHQSAKGTPSLSIHAPGNWKKADFGGLPEKICPTSSLFLKHLFLTLNDFKNKYKSDHETTLEVTHHGPHIEKPCCFIEIGSSEKQWKDEFHGKLVADTINKAVNSFNKEKLKYKPAIGIGGPHYCPNFNKIQLKSNIALSHIIPQYAFPINENMIEQAIDKTIENVDLAIIDWKGLKGEERQNTVKILESVNLPYKRTSEIDKK